MMRKSLIEKIRNSSSTPEKAGAGTRPMNGIPIPRYRDLFSVFFKIGLFTFGGGFAMIPLIHREMVEKRRWIGDGEIVDMLALAQTVPGAVAINAATLMGRHLRGVRGGLVATAGVILPSFVIITIIAAFFGQFQNEPIVKAAFLGLRPAVAALLVLAVWKVGKSSVRDALGWLLVFLTVFLVIVLEVHALFAILGSALLGGLLYLLLPGYMGRLVAGDQDNLPAGDRDPETVEIPSSEIMGIRKTETVMKNKTEENGEKKGDKPIC